MARPACDLTEESETVREIPVWRCMTFHDFGLALSGVLAVGAILTSFYLIFRHATHYLKPWQQRHIIRVLFMVPVFSTVSFLSYLYYRHAIYLEAIRDCYEAFGIASFFALLCSYTGPDLHSQKDYFRDLRPKAWLWPLNWLHKCCCGQKGIWRTPRSGLTWFNIIWFGIFQYCLIRVLMTLVAVVTEATGRFCIESMRPAFAHFWVMLIGGGSVIVAMYCQVQFYIQLKDDLIEHTPFLKILAVKVLILLSFWQTQILWAFRSLGWTKPTDRFGRFDIKFGIPSFLLCIEMAIFSVFHLWAYPWSDYDVRQLHIATSEPDLRVALEPATPYSGGPCGISAFADAFNLWDVVKGVARAFKWFFVGRRIREQDVSYTDSGRATALQPMRKVFALRFPFPEDRFLQHQNYFPADNGSQTCIGGSTAYDYSHVNEEQEAVEQENDLLSKPQSNSPRGSSPPIPTNQHQIIQNSNQAPTKDTSTTNLPLESSNHPQEPYSRIGTPQLTLPEFHVLKTGFQEEDLTHHAEDPTLAPLEHEASLESSNPYTYQERQQQALHPVPR